MEDATTWETNEVRLFLINDEAMYSIVYKWDVEDLETMIREDVENFGPIHESFRNHGGNWGLVNWQEVWEDIQNV